MKTMLDDSPFFRVVERINELYVTYRGRFVIAAPNSHIFIPHTHGMTTRLTDKHLIAHLNQVYAVAVYAGPKTSKFVCFDVDIPDKEVVRKVISAIEEFGFPRDRIYVSTSGGKGYHVELFFTDIMFTKHLINMYSTICAKHGFDERKIEFRPTHGQSIKLPLSRHHKTGNICWYLDRDTLEPIEDIEYVFQIEQIDRDWATNLIIQNIDREMIECEAITKSDHYKNDGCPELVDFEDQYPMITAPGMRNHLMVSIAIHERRRGVPQKQIEELLIKWASKQNMDYVNSSWVFIVQHASQIAKWVWSDQFLCVNQRLYITENDIACILSQRPRLQKRILFLIILFFRKFGVAILPIERIRRYVGGSQKGIKLAVGKIEEQGLIEHTAGKKFYHDGTVKTRPNQYRFKPDINRPIGKQIPFDWDFKEESFNQVYLKTIRENVPESDWEKYFTAKELAELKGENENG